MSPSEKETEQLNILDWLKETFNLETTEEEIEIFGISSNILQKIDQLVEVSEKFLMDSSDTKQKLLEVREYFAKFPRAVINGEDDTSDAVAGQPVKRRYNWVSAPKLEG